jgi:hypothetical protein
VFYVAEKPMIRSDERWAASDALRLMLRPAAEYSARVARSRESAWVRAISVPVLLAGLLGIVTAVATTGRVVVSLVVSQAVCWTFVPVLQLATGSMLIGSARDRPVTFSRAVELLFAAHGPWSLWLVAMGVLQSVSPNQNLVLSSSLIPFTWTGWMLFGYGRTVLGLTPRQSRTRVGAHQVATVFLILVYVELASRLSVRLIGVMQ